MGYRSNCRLQPVDFKPDSVLVGWIARHIGPTASTADPSIVTLGQKAAKTSDGTYSSRGLPPDSMAPLALENQLQDKLTLALQGNIFSSSAAGRLHGLGAALLAQLSAGSSQYSQYGLPRSYGDTNLGNLGAGGLGVKRSRQWGQSATIGGQVPGRRGGCRCDPLPVIQRRTQRVWAGLGGR